jgi:hypothetical protein
VQFPRYGRETQTQHHTVMETTPQPVLVVTQGKVSP